MDYDNLNAELMVYDIDTIPAQAQVGMAKARVIIGRYIIERIWHRLVDAMNVSDGVRVSVAMPGWGCHCNEGWGSR